MDAALRPADQFAVFNRFNPAYEEAACDQGATPWQSLVHVLLPLIGPSLVGVGMFGFTLSWDAIARSSQSMGDLNTLPLELQGFTTTVTPPVIYAVGTVTTLVSFLVMGVTLGMLAWWRRRQAGAPASRKRVALRNVPTRFGRPRPAACRADPMAGRSSPLPRDRRDRPG